MTGLLAMTLLAVSRPGYSWQDIVQPNFRDASFVVRAIKGNQKELKKINSDFATSYRFSFMKAQVKEPFMIRLESTVEDTNLLYIENGARRMYKIPKTGMNVRQSIADSPGKRQTTMDFGLLTPALFGGLFDATFRRVDRESGDLVFDLTYKHPKYHDTSRHRIWVDPQRRYVKKRVWFAQDGHEMATFTYDRPEQVNGIWLPTRLTVRNVEDKVAGVTEYSDLRVNTGIPASRFAF